MNSVLNRIRKPGLPTILEIFIVIAVSLVVIVLIWEPKAQNYELYLSRESCPLLQRAGLEVSSSETEGCRYQGPARQLLSNWKIGNLVIQEAAVIAYRKVKS